MPQPAFSKRRTLMEHKEIFEIPDDALEQIILKAFMAEAFPVGLTEHQRISISKQYDDSYRIEVITRSSGEGTPE